MKSGAVYVFHQSPIERSVPDGQAQNRSPVSVHAIAADGEQSERSL